MMCRSCHRESHHIRTIVDGDGVIDLCHREDCGNLSAIDAGVPDVYLGHVGQTFKALCDERGNPIPIQSKRHKKQVMDQLGVRECPERLTGKTWIEGTRETRRKNFDEVRPVIRDLYRRYLDNARRLS